MSGFSKRQSDHITPELFVRAIGWGVEDVNGIMSALLSEKYEIEIKCEILTPGGDIGRDMVITINQFRECTDFNTADEFLASIKMFIDGTCWLDGELDRYTVVFSHTQKRV